MAVLKNSEVKKLDKKAREEKLKDLRLELIKANVAANKQNAKTKEIKKAIARLLTFDKAAKAEESKQE